MRKGFTLIELLVVVSIIGILIGISLVALGGARAGGRDTKRRSDLEQIRSGLELFRADCGKYPASITFGSAFTGDGSISACPGTNIYMQTVPRDPQTTNYTYYYTGSTTAYTLCAYLETGSGTVSGCGSCSAGAGSAACNYKVNNP